MIPLLNFKLIKLNFGHDLIHISDENPWGNEKLRIAVFVRKYFAINQLRKMFLRKMR